MYILPEHWGHGAAYHYGSLILCIYLSGFFLVHWFVACLNQYYTLKVAEVLVYNYPQPLLFMTVLLSLSIPHQVNASNRGGTSFHSLLGPGGSFTMTSWAEGWELPSLKVHTLPLF